MPMLNRRHFLKSAFVVSGVVLLASNAKGTTVESSTLSRRLRFELNFTNPFAVELEMQKFWCYLPAQTSMQQLSQIYVSMPYKLQRDDLGHNILELTFDRFPALAQKIVVVTVDVAINEAAHHQDLVNPNQWLSPERFIESDDAHIRLLASQLHRSSDDETVHTIFEWVSDHIIDDGYIADDLGALQALIGHKGDCTEYADLVVALARANKIPARMMGGYVTDHDYAPRPADYHNWAEVYLDGQWQVVDAQKRNWLEPKNQYIPFRIYRDHPTNEIGLAHRYRLDGSLLVNL